MAAATRTTLAHWIAAVLLAACFGGGVSLAQEQSIVTVDESPTASLLLQQLKSHLQDNVAESARLAAQLMDQFGNRLVPVREGATDQFTTVRRRVNRLLLAHGELRERFCGLQGAFAEAQFAAGDYAETVACCWATRAGLDASLILAQQDFEAGRFSRAVARLEALASHSDLANERSAQAHRLHLLALAQHQRADSEDALTARRALASLVDANAEWPEGERLLAHVDALLAQSPVTTNRNAHALDAHDVDAPQERGWHAVWTGQIETAVHARAMDDRQDNTNAAQRLEDSERQTAASLHATPLVLDELIITSDGVMLRAFDRFGAEEGWALPLIPEPPRRAGVLVDLSEVSFDGEGLLTISGLAASTGRSSGSAVSRVDPHSGQLLWQTRINSIESPQRVIGAVDPAQPGTSGAFDLTGAFPYAGPIPAGDVAVIVARKVNSRRETVLYLIGLALKDGQPRWVRVLGSSTGVRTQRGFSRPIFSDGLVYVASPVGIVACIEPSTGEPVWLRRFSIPLSRTELTVPPWEIAQPAVLGDHLFVVAPDGLSVLQLNRMTGEQLNAWPIGVGTNWDKVRYLIADPSRPNGGTLYAIGDDIIAFDGDALGQPRWRFSITAQGEVALRSGATVRNGIRGRVHVAGDTLLVPGVNDLLLVRAATGRVQERLVTNGPTNSVLLESQLVLCGLDDVTSLMQLGPAESLLRDRIDSDPADPSRALGLFELGLQAGQPALSLEAADAALRALQGRDDEAGNESTRERLVAMLLRLYQACLAPLDTASAEQAIAFAQVAARTDQQRAQVAIARGDLLRAAGDLDEALTVWLDVLSDASLADTLLPQGDHALRARLRVNNRFTKLESDDRARLEALASAQSGSSALATLEMNAARFGPTIAARDFWLAAATDAFAASDSKRAQRALSAAIQARPRDALLRFEAAKQLTRAGFENDATQLLRNGLQQPAMRGALLTLSEQFPDVLPARQWRARLGLSPQDAIEIPGRLLLSNAHPLDTDGRLLSIIDRTLQLRRTPGDADPQWQTQVADREPAMLSMDDTELVLWTQPSMDSAYAMALDIDSGATLWRTPPADELFTPIQIENGASGRFRGGMMPGGGLFQPKTILPVLGANTLTLVRRAGEVVSLSRGETDKPPRVKWTLDSGLDRIYITASTDHILALGGAVTSFQADGQRREIPTVVLIDLEAGRVVSRFSPSSEDGIRWMRLSPIGTILIGLRNGVEAFATDGTTGPVWRNNSLAVSALSGAQVFGERLLGEQVGGGLVAMDLVTGELQADPFAMPEDADWRPNGLIAMAQDLDGVTALFVDRLVRFDSDGVVTGADAVDSTRAFVTAIETESQTFVVEERPRNAQDGSYWYWIHRFDRDAGCKLAGPSLELMLPDRRLNAMRATDGWLLLSTGASVISVPFPVAVEDAPSPGRVGVPE